MIKVLKKTFGILETIAGSIDKPLLLGMIAKKLNIAQPTCSRIVKDLVNMGYVEQSEGERGYLLGAKAYALVRGWTYRKDITDIARPYVLECAEEIKECVLLAVLRNGRRYILCHHNGNPEIQVLFDKPFYEDVYSTATGRLLLALSPEREIHECIKRNGLPEQNWGNTRSKKTLMANLTKIKQDGFVVDVGSRVAKIAYPVLQNGSVAAVLGVSVSRRDFVGKHKEHILKRAESTARKISAKLSA